MGTSDGTKIDWAVAMEAVGGNEQLLAELIEIFFQEYPKLVGAIQTSIESKVALDLQRAAHTLKGSLRYFGESDAGHIALELETMGRDGDFANATATVQRLQSAAAPLLPQLRDFADKHGDGKAD